MKNSGQNSEIKPGANGKKHFKPQAQFEIIAGKVYSRKELKDAMWVCSQESHGGAPEVHKNKKKQKVLFREPITGKIIKVEKSYTKIV